MWWSEEKCQTIGFFFDHGILSSARGEVAQFQRYRIGQRAQPGRMTLAQCANTAASMLSVLANWPVALAKSLTWRGLTTATGNSAPAEAWVSARSNPPHFLHCVASKGALIGMTRSLAREVGEYGICVNAIAPGLVEHEGHDAPKALAELQLKLRSIKRLQTPQNLMGTLVSLCSSDSDFMTGQSIVVEGGSVFH